MAEESTDHKPRRRFIEICSVSVGAGACPMQVLAADPATKKPREIDTPDAVNVPVSAKKYARVKLVDNDGRAIKAKSLKANHNYIFNYPYESTPCFLLNLDEALAPAPEVKSANGQSYAWPGGVGVKKSIVAYSAICAHKMAYPSKQVSFIGFRATASGISPRGKVISCCADKSVYDPFVAAKVISGPAPQPLAAILLEHDAKTDELFAVGTVGAAKFDAFFQKYEFKLSLDVGSRAKETVTATTKVFDLAAYSAQTAQC